MKLVIDNEKDQLLEEWKSVDGEYVLALNAGRSLEVLERLSEKHPRGKASKLLLWMQAHIDDWNSIHIDFESVAAQLKTTPKLIRKYLAQLDGAEAFTNIEGDRYHFDPDLVFKPQFAPLWWLRKVS